MHPRRSGRRTCSCPLINLHSRTTTATPTSHHRRTGPPPRRCTLLRSHGMTATRPASSHHLTRLRTSRLHLWLQHDNDSARHSLLTEPIASARADPDPGLCWSAFACVPSSRFTVNACK
jgi:hypothetical protein